MGIALCFMGVIMVDHEKFKWFVHQGKNFICQLDLTGIDVLRGDIIHIVDKDSTKRSLRKKYVDFELKGIGDRMGDDKEGYWVRLERVSRVLRLPEQGEWTL